eukprot:GAHX01005035.1.p1 GENE.GAHX01005035.1~~GAHX01005035.1.p1  ORF type:complete len:355 (-),score=57.38 GAHX01005035.1:2-1066(-)
MILKLFSKYNLPIPTETTARRHLEEITEDINNLLVLNFKDNPIFCIADSSTINNSHYTICLIGMVDTPNKTYLATLDINKTPVDSAYISRTIDEALKKFEIKRENFYLLISDAARYMEKAASLLKNFYPSLINITCLSHLLHNVCLKIKNHFKNVDNLIGYTKALIQKNSTRRALFCDIGQPPTPIVTRWGSWLNAANYYIQHYEEVKEIVMGLRESGSIEQKAQQCFIEDTLNKEELREIHTCYSFLVEIIDDFTKKKYNVEMGYEMVKDLEFGDDPVNIKQYIDKRLDRNQISEICDFNSNLEISAREGLLKCQSTSVDVERAFSLLNNLLTDNRNFEERNIIKYMTCYYNS